MSLGSLPFFIIMAYTTYSVISHKRTGLIKGTGWAGEEMANESVIIASVNYSVVLVIDSRMVVVFFLPTAARFQIVVSY